MSLEYEPKIKTRKRLEDTHTRGFGSSDTASYQQREATMIPFACILRDGVYDNTLTSGVILREIAN